MSMDANQKRQAIAAIAKDINSCNDCGLCAGVTNHVPGEGNPDAKIVFIGEGPGFYEDRQGRPFVGASGKFLDELLASIGLDRTKVYITNVVKCRPPNNRDPQADEIATCRRHLDAQLEAIDPKVVVTLGRHSMQRYFPGESIGRVHGQPRRKGEVIVVPMYHPAAALHQQSLRNVIQADFAKLPEFLAKTLGEPSAAAPDETPVPAHLRKDAPYKRNERTEEEASGGSPQGESQQMRLL
jgi:uracil-DNA glycosylase